MPQRSFTRDQPLLLPPSVHELVPADHPIRFVAVFVEQLPDAIQTELGVSGAAAQRGAPRYAPALLLLVWLAGFMQGVRTSRKLEYACRYDLAFRWLTAGQTPDHNTLWRFYAAHRQIMRALLTQTVLTAVHAQLADLVEQAVDGTKVLANAAKERSLTPAELQQLRDRIEAAIAELESQQEGDAEPPPPSLPAELASQQALRERVRAALDQVGETASRGNLTDPEARMMHTRHGIRPAYNAQAVTVALNAEQAGRTGRLILATEVTTAPDDHGQLAPMIAAAQLPDQPVPLTLADGGYHSGPTLADCADAGYQVVLPESQTPAQRRNPYHKDHFVHDAEQDTYTCPAGQVLTNRGSHQRRDGREVTLYRGEPSACHRCAAGSACTTAKQWGRTVQIGAYETQLRAHRQWMESPEAQQAAKRRGPLIEAVFGTLKEEHQGRRFQLRGLTKVTAEWALLATGYNLRTLARVWAANPGFRSALGGGTAPPLAPAA